MNRALPEMLHTLNPAGNSPDGATVLERQRARIKWHHEQFLQQPIQNGNGFFSGGFPPPLTVDQLQNFHGFMAADSPLAEMVMAAVKPDPGFEDGWTDINSSISRTSSCPPAGKLAAAVGRESFKKRKAKVSGEEETKEKRVKTRTEEGDSKITDQNNSTTTNNNRETSADTSKENSKASEVQKPDYIHVRARRGQATDSHSLAERARREKISERMKYLQDLVPGCNKITGKAGMLDEIINYVQSLQRQVEFLSMKLATVNPRLDFNVDDLFTKEVFPPANFPAMEITDPSSFIEFNPNTHQMVSSCGVEMGINPPDAGLRRTISAPVSFPENFLDASGMTQFQPFSGWDVDLQNLYNVGFDQGRSSIFCSQPYTGTIEGSNIKMEM